METGSIQASQCIQERPDKARAALKREECCKEERCRKSAEKRAL
jgi:hypothetical protein